MEFLVDHPGAQTSDVRRTGQHIHDGSGVHNDHAPPTDDAN